MEGLQKQHYIYDMSVTQLRQIMAEWERRRGRQFFDSEPVPRQSVTMLVHTVERCLQEQDANVECSEDRIKQVLSLH